MGMFIALLEFEKELQTTQMSTDRTMGKIMIHLLIHRWISQHTIRQEMQLVGDIWLEIMLRLNPCKQFCILLLDK
jgi:hypothetical protein